VPENLEQAVGFLRRCLDNALRGGVRAPRRYLLVLGRRK
jgi:hypothetical protein